MTFEIASRYADEHDVVLVGYRGIDGSVRLDCPEVESALEHNTDLLDEETSEAYADAFRSCADRLTAAGIDLGSYGVVQQVDDMEAARTALGYDKIDLLSERCRDPYGDDLFLALLGQHPSVGHDRRQPAWEFPLVPEHDRRADRSLRPCALRTTPAVGAPTTSPPHCIRRTLRFLTAGSSFRSRRATCASPHSSD